MKIKKVFINNFLSFEKAELDLDNRGVLFIKGENKDTGGSNGAGKSTLIPESVVWTLFGDTIRGIDLKDEIVNSRFSGDCMGCVELENEFKIIRTRKHKQYGNTLMLVHKDQNISKSTMDLTQKEINKLFNIDFDIFVNSIVLSGSSIRANFLDSKNNLLRRQIIESILGIDKFTNYASTVKDKIKDIESKKSMLYRDIERCEMQIKGFNDKIAELRYQKQEFEQNKAKKIQEIKDTIQKLEMIDVKQQLDIYEKLGVGNSIKAKIKGNIQGLSAQFKELDTKLKGLDIKIAKYTNFINKACEYCGSVLDADKLNTMIQALEYEKSKINAEKQGAVTNIAIYQKHISEIDNQIAGLTPALSEQELQNINIEIQVNKTKLQEIQASSFQDISFDAEINKLLQDIQVYKQTTAKLDEEFKYYKFWEIGFGNKGLKTYILDDMIQFLNKKIDFYLNILSKGDMHLVFDKFLEFDVSGLKYRNCSSGERKRVDLAVLIALYDLTNLRNKTNYNILILDEVLDSIDEIGIEAAQELLKELNQRIPTIFVISHNNTLAEYFPDSITIVKEHGISKIV